MGLINGTVPKKPEEGRIFGVLINYYRDIGHVGFASLIYEGHIRREFDFSKVPLVNEPYKTLNMHYKASLLIDLSLKLSNVL